MASPGLHVEMWQWLIEHQRMGLARAVVAVADTVLIGLSVSNPRLKLMHFGHLAAYTTKFVEIFDINRQARNERE